MKFLKKISLSFLLFILIFQSISTSVYAVSTIGQTDIESKQAIIITDDDDEEVPLFKELTNSSKILMSLLAKDEVLVLNEFEKFSHVEYIDKHDESIQGFINNDNLELIDSKSEELDGTDSDKTVEESEKASSDDDNTTEEDISDDSSSETETTDDADSEVIGDDTDSDKTETESEKANSDEEDINDDSSSETETTDDADSKVIDEDMDSDKTETESEKVNSDDDINDDSSTETETTDDMDSEDIDEGTEKENLEGNTVKKSNSPSLKRTTAAIQQQIELHGIALKSPTTVYATQSTNSSKLKSYDQGSILKYKSFNSQWYQATVYVNGKYTTGYIHKSDVESPITKQETLSGIATKNPTKVYSKASTGSNALKSYAAGSILKYKTFTADWYQATVYVNGKYTTGYIHKSDIENPVTKQETLSGIATKNPTKVYSKPSTGSNALKSYAAGNILKYKTFTADWYQATVYVNGKYTTGYIHKSDIENPVTKQETLSGIATKNPTKVYSKPSTGSNVLKSYAAGNILKYKTFTADWYQATVYVNGKYTTGYIHKSDVENPVTKQETLSGIAAKNPTKVYSKPSTGSNALKSYAAGNILKYKTFTTEWYQATVYVNGKYTTGYIHKSDVENPVTKQETLSGIAAKNPTKVYSKASTGSNALKSYAAGSVLKYKTFTTEWYKATVYVNGKYTTGYIHKSDVESPYDKQEGLKGWALKGPTNIYLKASRTSSVIKTYNQFSSLKFKTFSPNWYEATVYINGKPKTGYIHVDDITFDDLAKNTEYNLTLEKALEIQMGASPQTDNPYAYVSKSYIDNNNKVTADKLNVRSGSNTSNKVVGQLSKGTSVTILGEFNGWYQIAYKSNQWVNASPSDILYYLDPTNFLNDEEQRFQFLDLTKTSGTTVTSLNNYLKGKGTLAGQGQAFIDAGHLYGINEMYLVSHAILETGNGSSTLAKGVKYNGVTVYNMFGIGAYDSCPVDCGAERAYNEGWTTPYKAIVGGANFIGNSYVKSGLNTLYKMRWNPEAMANTGNYGKQYATDIGWASKQIYTLYDLYQELDSYVLNLDIPSYK